MWWLWVLGGLVVWIVVALVLAVVIGRGIRLADQRSGRVEVLTTADLPVALRPAPVAAPTRRRAIPLPTVGIALIAVAVVLETCGYVLRLTDSRGAAAQVFSMDAPYSLPRLYVAALCAAAALAAVAGSGSIPGRRTWWLAVGLVAGGVAAVKAGSNVHSRALAALGDAVGAGPALLLSALAAAAVVGVLWFLSRGERRDRRLPNNAPLIEPETLPRSHLRDRPQIAETRSGTRVQRSRFRPPDMVRPTFLPQRGP